MPTRFLSTLLLTAIVAYTLSATPVGTINVVSLTARSDAIVMGRVVSIVQEGKTTVDESGGSIPAERFRASIVVNHLVKGPVPAGPVPVTFAVPTTALGYPDVFAGQYALFFLEHRKGSYEFTDRWYPYLPSVESQEFPSGSPLDQVTAVLGEDLESSQLSNAQREQVLDALGRLLTELAGDILRQALRKTSGDLRLEIARRLVARNDVAGFAEVEEALLHPAALSDRTLLNLAGSLSGLKDARAIPGLTRLSEAVDPTTRRYAASALRQTSSPAAVAPLAKLLNDTDVNTRYDAVAGLGEITRQDEWTPALDEFKQHETKYISYWHHWVEVNLN